MSESLRRLDRQQQVRRIAHVLGTEDPLEALADVPAEQLRQLHDQFAESLFAAHKDSFARVAAVSKVVPGAIAGKLAERFLQPALAARAAVMLEPARAGDLVNKVSVPYLADIALSLDPVRGTPVIKAIPPARVAQVAAELFRRDELAAMAEFAGSVDKAALDAALAVATPAQLVRVAPLLTWNQNIEEIIDELSDDRLDAILRAVADEDLWDQASVLLRRLRPETLARVADRLAGLPGVAAQIPSDVVAELATDLFETDELATMVLFAPVVPDAAFATALQVAGGANLLRIAPLLDWTPAVHGIVARLSDAQLDDVLQAMAADDLWSEASVLLRRVSPETLARVADRLQAQQELAAQIPPQLIHDLATDLFADDQLDTMLLFVPVVSADALAAAIEAAGAANLLRIAPLIEWTETVHAVLDGLDDRYLDAILAEIVAKDLGAEAGVLLRRVPPATIERLAQRLHADRDLAERIPATLIRDLALDLFSAGRLTLMVQFVPVVSNAAVAAVIDGFDESDLDALLAQVAEQDLWGEAEVLVARLDDDARSRIVARAVLAPQELVDRITAAVLANTDHAVLREIAVEVETARTGA